MGGVVHPDQVALDRELREDLWVERDARQLFDQALQVHGKEDVDAPLQLIRGQMSPAVEVFEDALQRIHEWPRATP